MKRILTLLLSVAAGAVAAQPTSPDYGASTVLRIWDNTTAPHSNGITTPESITGSIETPLVGNTSTAELYIYPADAERATGQAVVICPGGGYQFLCMVKEGSRMAEWLAANGITAAVLKYRMPNGHPEVPLEDTEQALRLLRGEVPGAEGHTAASVGIMGFSAGGHLAAMSSTTGNVRPDFAVLFYPVITGEQGHCHKGSFDHLLGPDRTAEATLPYWLERRVTDKTPPTLLLLSDDDDRVPPINSTRYYDALKAHGIPASMHIYPEGGHGWGMRDDFRYKADWQPALLDWLATLRKAD